MQAAGEYQVCHHSSSSEVMDIRAGTQYLINNSPFTSTKVLYVGDKTLIKNTVLGAWKNAGV